MTGSDQLIVRRATMVLFLSQSVTSAAFITSTTINPLVAAQLGGQEALAGLPSALMLVGASMAAYPAGQMMGVAGRRYGLLIGCAIGIAGAVVSAVSVITSSLLLFFVGLLLLGAGRGTLDQGRYAAAEINPPLQRARAMSTVVFGGTVGAILGPGLVAPAGQVTNSLGLQVLSGPFLATAGLLSITAAVVFFLLSTDLRGVAQRVARQYPADPDRSDVDAATVQNAQHRSSILSLFNIRDARIALITMTSAQATMVMMMAIIALHMTHHDHGLGDVSLVTMAHVLGMYAFSPLIGRVADRIGRKGMIRVSAVVIGIGCVVAPLSLNTPLIALALFLVGLGWSGCYITGSTLLTDAIAGKERAQMQGANDTLVNITSAVGSLSSGVLLQAFGFNLLSLIGLGVALLPVLVLAFTQPLTLQDEPSAVK